MKNKSKKYILWFKDISLKDVSLVGGKNASLGEMFSQLTKKGINIPDGFALTSKAYWYYIKANKIDKKLKEIFARLDSQSLGSLKETGREARNLILGGEFPNDLKRDILKSYQKLSQIYGEASTDVAVRSSGTAEDLPGASFAGQFETFLNVKGEELLLNAIKKCFASLFNDRAIIYKAEKGFEQLGIKLSVGQKQRVAIARAILRNPKILILDEPTSALDAKSEKFIQESLEELMKGRTTFIIAHRLSTVRKADKILVIQEGKIIEQGRHEKLIQIPNGTYRQFYELQIGLM